MDGQAELAPVSADDLAQFLIDNPDADGSGAESTQKPEPPEESPEAEAEEEAEENDEAETDDDSPDDESPKDQASGQKIKVTIKGEDGADQTVEVDQKELISGYQRHADYTRKTMELANRENQAVEIVRSKITEAQQHYVQQAQMAQALVAQFAGIRTPAEMHELARVDPAGYVAEQARQAQVQSMINQIQQGWQEEHARTQQAQQEQLQEHLRKGWEVLQSKGFDGQKLTNVFDGFSREYGIEKDRFSGVTDPQLVLAMKDALAYRELQKKTSEAKKRVTATPSVPKSQPAPRNEAQDKKRAERLKTGRGSRDDLAAFIAQHNL